MKKKFISALLALTIALLSVVCVSALDDQIVPIGKEYEGYYYSNFIRQYDEGSVMDYRELHYEYDDNDKVQWALVDACGPIPTWEKRTYMVVDDFVVRRTSDTGFLSLATEYSVLMTTGSTI